MHGGAMAARLLVDLELLDIKSRGRCRYVSRSWRRGVRRYNENFAMPLQNMMQLEDAS